MEKRNLTRRGASATGCNTLGGGARSVVILIARSAINYRQGGDILSYTLCPAFLHPRARARFPDCWPRGETRAPSLLSHATPNRRQPDQPTHCQPSHDHTRHKLPAAHTDAT